MSYKFDRKKIKTAGRGKPIGADPKRSDALPNSLVMRVMQDSEAEKEAVAARKNERYRSLLNTLTPAAVDDSVRETLEVLRSRDGLRKQVN